ncbi:MAG: MFS transporter [Bacteroidia bacterium]
MLALIADFTNFIGIKNKGHVHGGIYIVSSIITRFLAGRWSDRYGRKIIALIGSIVLSLSMLLLSFTNEIIMYSLSSITFGIGFGLISPSLFAWAADVAIPGFKGKAVGTLFILWS